MNVQCFKWRNQCENCPQKREYPGSLLCDNSRENYRIKKELFTSLNKLQLVTPSEWLKGEVEQSFFKGIPCRAVPNGVELDTYYLKKDGQQDALKEKYGLKGKNVVLGVANVWTKQKGWDDFMQLPGLLPENYRVVMVGLSKKQQKELPSSVTGYPRTESLSQLADFYRMADIYFNGSCQETMGMTTGEAICCGTPAVVYRATAVPESVGDGCGAIIEPGDVKGAAEAMVELCSNGADYFNACKSYRKRFDKKIFGEAYYDIYREMLELERKGNEI
jgi:glycosyltransferase involved in cell wall biosynthesis